ncbi:hypothetical protein D560_2545 [Bordetella holmesii ATCC 51541]|nr:hypothetical protein D560_2545 [Bordetella holmesii ATCC 51541]EWM47771.1 hypothetical protein D555_2562 [Bordetella holmesii 35009]
MAWVLSTQVFDFAISLSLWPWFVGTMAGMAAAWGAVRWRCAECCARRL